MSRDTAISGIAVASSLLAYYYAKWAGRDRIPLMLIGGFVGAAIGEAIVKQWENEDA